MLPSMLFYAVTKLTETNLNITIGSKKWIGCVRFVSGPNRCVVSVPARIGSLNATEHGFLHGNETDRNEPKHHYWVQKSGLGAFVSFLARIGSSFWFRPESLHSMQSGMVFCIVTKLTKRNQNITIGSKKVDWVHSFCFWRELVVRFGSGPNRCIKCYPGMVFCTVTKVTKTSLLGPKKWIGCVRFVSGVNR